MELLAKKKWKLFRKHSENIQFNLAFDLCGKLYRYPAGQLGEQGEPLHRPDVASTHLHGGSATTLQVTSK